MGGWLLFLLFLLLLWVGGWERPTYHDEFGVGAHPVLLQGSSEPLSGEEVVPIVDEEVVLVVHPGLNGDGFQKGLGRVVDIHPEVCGDALWVGGWVGGGDRGDRGGLNELL